MLEMSPEMFRQLGHQAVEIVARQLEALPNGPARRPLDEDQRAGLMHSPLPEQGADPAALLAEVEARIYPYPMGNNSPRFFAWVNSPAAPIGVLGELLAAAHNPSVAGGDHAATYIEHAVLGWLKQIAGYPAESGGILTSGGSVANLIGLAAMRHAKAPQARQQGLFSGPPLIVYTSQQGHSCIQKAVELLGIGADNLRKLPTDADFRLDVRALRAAIQADKAAGLRPACVAASAGTVNTGAVDPLAEIADVCAQEGLWFHVDGSYGGVGRLDPAVEHLYVGVERADSLAIDPHKWLYAPVECGCAFVRDPQIMRDAFSLVPPYLRDDVLLPWFSEFGVQQSRAFKALKLWLMIQQAGAAGYREMIARDNALARHLEELITAHPAFELLGSGPLSIRCFRLAPPGVPAAELDALNRAALDKVQQDGHFYLTATQLGGQVALRACIVNFRTQESDLAGLLEALAAAV